MEVPEKLDKQDKVFKDHLKLPTNFIIDDEAEELLKYHLCKFICTREKIAEHKGLDVSVWLSYNCPLKIKHKNRWYWVALVKDANDNQFQWYMRPYNKSYYTTRANEEDEASFDMVIQAVIDHEKMFK